MAPSGRPHQVPRRPRRQSAQVEAHRLAAIVESSDDAIIGIALDGRIESWNAGAERIYGYAAEEALGRSLALVIPRERHDELLVNLDRLRRGEPVAPYETVRIRKDGARIHVSLVMSPVRDAARRIVGASGIGRDVTLQRQAERRAMAQLRVNRLLVQGRDLDDVAARLLEALAEEMDWAFGSLWLVDRPAEVLRCRETFSRSLPELAEFDRVSREMTFGPGVGLPGRVWASGEPAWIEDVLEDGNFPRATAAAAAGLRGAVGFPLRTNRGVLGVVECFSPEVRRPDAGLVLLMGSIGNELGQFVERGWAGAERRDLLVRERVARASAEASRERLRFLLDASTELAASLDAEAIVATACRLAVPHLADACAIDLLDEPSVLRSAAVVLADPGDASAARRGRTPPDPASDHPEAAALRAGHALLAPDPAAAWPGSDSVIALPLIARGRPLGAMLLVTAGSARRYGEDDVPLAEDLARRVALALDNAALFRDAQAAVLARDRFLARAAHELRTPLTSALGTVRLLARALDGRLKQRPEDLADIASRSLEAMAVLVNDLLDVSRLAAGGDDPRLAVVDLTALVARATSVVAPQADEKGIVLHEAVPAGITLEADGQKLEQVLVNLLGNAVKFTAPSGRVTVEAEAVGRQVTLRVRDTGVGIPPADLDAIFQPFFRASHEPRLRSRGTGLGLAICRQIVTLHGGRIWAESEGPGRGTTLVVRLPLAPPDRQRS